MVKLELHLEEILMDFLEPLLITAKDTKGQLYLGCAIDHERIVDPFLCVEITQKQIDSVKKGTLDVYRVYMNSKKPLFVADKNFSTLTSIRRFRSIITVPKSYIPSKGLYL